jgi:hypothetical protein
MPDRIRPPGEISAYSNYGAALAGHIVSQVSGEPWDAYVRRHLLDPLAMAHSTASEPVPPALAGDLARSYNSDSAPPRPVPFEFDRMPPDGAISASAGDMARFMIAHLDDGGGGILTPATAARMHTRSFAADPRLGGWAHGFMAREMNGRPVLMHDGGWEGFVSGLILVPDCDLGLFVSANATGGAETFAEVLPAFFDRFAPSSDAAADPRAAAPTGPPPPGFYAPTRRTASTVEKVLVLLGPARLRVDPDGTVHFRGGEWTDVGGGLYRRADGADHLVFRAGPDGRQYVATDGPAFEPLCWSETLPVNLAVLLGFAVVALSALAVPLAAGVRRLRRRPAATRGSWRMARGLAAGAALGGLVALAAVGVSILGDTSDYIYGAPLGFRLVLALPVLVLGVAAVAAALTVRGWRTSGAGVVARAHQVVLFVGLGALGWFLWQWNLLGWQF